jgi:hypothetical protein
MQAVLHDLFFALFPIKRELDCRQGLPARKTEDNEKQWRWVQDERQSCGGRTGRKD